MYAYKVIRVNTYADTDKLVARIEAFLERTMIPIVVTFSFDRSGQHVFGSAMHVSHLKVNDRLCLKLEFKTQM